MENVRVIYVELEVVEIMKLVMRRGSRELLVRLKAVYRDIMTANTFLC